MVKICSTDYSTENEAKYEQYFKSFPYQLSPFQKHSIQAIVEGNHCLVTAHTGSGKTLPAEFAIQHFTDIGKKIIYCSPIKALSNQKYYEFSNKYPHISFGLYTGDIKTNPEAQVIIMTTEILMNYLFVYNKHDPTNVDNATKTTINNNLDFNINIENELACVVFDEVHYINDAERGQVWEKTMLMLPHKVQLVMLSATIDNPEGFACWIETQRLGIQTLSENDKIVYLASTTKRVVPLTEYCFLTTTEAVFKGMKDKELEKQIRDNTNTLLMLQDSNGKFADATINTVSKMLKLFETKQVMMKRQNVLNNLCLHLRDHEMLPAIAFVFSRKQVEVCASEITVPLLEFDSKVGYTVRREAEQIIRKLPNFKEYLELPEYNKVVSLLEKGIGIHHSGMIPVLREIVELMISKKYIKLLFATESFAIGLDCPIKTAIFTSLTKFDGNSERYLLAHEYSQMKGRAGRRGIDTVGHVVHLNNLFKLPTMNEYKTILSGKPQQLISKFHISYPLILNLLKNDQTSNFDNFSEKSMMQKELLKSVQCKETQINDLIEKVNKKTEFINRMRTHYTVCLNYINIENQLKNLVNKKKKDAERELRNIEDEYYSLKDDLKLAKEFISLNDQLHDEKTNLSYMSGFISEQTNKVCQVLIDDGFVVKNKDNCEDDVKPETETYSMTHLGIIASNIAEIHPLIISRLMIDYNYFEKFNTTQLIGLFSCFTNVKIPNDQKSSVPNTDDEMLKKCIKDLQNYYKQYDKLEFENDLRTGIKYDDELIFDMIEFSMKWCDCDNENDCKYFIQTDVADKSISIGDFTKAMLKIVTITKEMMNVCEMIGEMELMYKLSKIEGLVLKYVTTSQSLYV
jgi:superfamily II RNA helicase